jgi:hypothetical protein
VAALRGARRVVRPSGPVFVAAIARWAPRLDGELRAAGLEVLDLVSVEGLAFALSDLDERMEDPLGRAVVLDAARALERVPELLGIGPHLLATAVRPTA